MSQNAITPVLKAEKTVGKQERMMQFKGMERAKKKIVITVIPAVRNIIAT